jgi:hypothetical protein
MIKHVFVFESGVNSIDADRYYFRYHSKEVVRFLGPWLRRYETYRAFDAPAEADQFGMRRGRLTELWYDNVDDWKEAAAYARPYTPPPGGWEAFFGTNGAVTIVPAMPTEDFLRKEPTPEERPILRWYQVFKYPEGVSIEEGERWYVEAFAEEMKKQPGLLRFVSHRVLAHSPFPTPWHRVSELWFEGFAAWREAVIAGAENFTPPKWRVAFPFVDMVSTFVGYKPDVDFLNDNPTIP